MPTRYQRKQQSTTYNKRYKFSEAMPDHAGVTTPMVNKLTEGHVTKGKEALMKETPENRNKIISETLIDERTRALRKLESAEPIVSLDDMVTRSEQDAQQQIQQQREAIHKKAIEDGDVLPGLTGPKFTIGLLQENARRDLGITLNLDGSLADGFMNKMKAKMKSKELRKIQEQIAVLYTQLSAQTKAQDVSQRQEREDIKKLGLGWYQRVVRPIALTLGLGGALGGGMKAGADQVDAFVQKERAVAGAKYMEKMDSPIAIDSNKSVEFQVIPEIPEEEYDMAEKKIRAPKPLRFDVGQELPNLEGYSPVGEAKTYTVGDIDLHPEEVVTRQDITRQLKGSTLGKTIREKIYTQNGKEIGRAFVLSDNTGAPDRTVFASTNKEGKYVIDAVTNVDDKGNVALQGTINPEMKAHFSKFGGQKKDSEIAQRDEMTK